MTDFRPILNAVGRMFPNLNLNQTATKVQQALQGTGADLGSVRSKASNLGLNAGAINDIYTRYGQTAQARAICRLLGTTPEALKADADKIVGNSNSPLSEASAPREGQMKFPRLK